MLIFEIATIHWGLFLGLELLPGEYFWIWNNLLGTVSGSGTIPWGVLLDLEQRPGDCFWVWNYSLGSTSGFGTASLRLLLDLELLIEESS